MDQPRGAPRGSRLPDLGHVDVRLGHRDRRADIVALGELLLEHFRHDGAERIHRHDAVRVRPLRIRSERIGGHGVGEVRAMIPQQGASRDRQRAVDAVGAAVGADHVALAARERAAHDRSALARVGTAPSDRQRAMPALDRMRSEADVFQRRMLGRHGRRSRRDNAAPSVIAYAINVPSRPGRVFRGKPARPPDCPRTRAPRSAPAAAAPAPRSPTDAPLVALPA